MNDLDLVTGIPQRGDCLRVTRRDSTSIVVGRQHRVLIAFKRTSGHYDKGWVGLARNGVVRLANHIILVRV